jgi:hypothetical protein
MKKQHYLFFSLFLSFYVLSFALSAQKNTQLKEKKAADAKAIKSMCGCYEVEFAFSETFAPDSNYQFKPNYLSSGLEWVELVEDKEGKIVLQHLLIVNDTTIVKHWRQDWLFENTIFYTFEKDNTWRFKKVKADEVKGQWTQRVFQVDDSPRYEGSASWVHVDGRSYWESVADSPLPRREFTKRNDYNVLKRRNRHEITAYGWLHEQDNEKILRQTSNLKSNYQDTWIASEKGLNPYRRVENSRCAAAQKWWQQNQEFWAAVRAEWTKIFEAEKDLILRKTVDEKPLFMHIFSLKDIKEIRPTIEKFLLKED